MRQRSLFDQLCVYVSPDALASADFELLECCLRDGGASLSADAQAATVTHVVCHPTEYARFAGGRTARFYPIVRSEWVLRTFALQKKVPVDTFSADPRLFFSTLAIAAGSIDKDPRKVIDGLIAHFGGQVIEDPGNVSGATHVLSPDGIASEASVTDAQRALQLAYSGADVDRQVELWKQWLDERPSSLDFSLPGCLVAHIGKGAGLNETHHVNYAWIEECVRRKQHVAETPFSKASKPADDSALPNWKSRLDVKVEELDLGNVAAVYLNARTAAASATCELAAVRKVSADRLAVMQTALAGAIVLIAQHIPSQLKESVSEILKAAKAKVANVPLGDSYPDIVRKVVANASFVVCRYQSGLEYEEAVRQKKEIVSVYWVLAGLGVNGEGGELRDALLQPVKTFGGVPGMESFVITLSGFNSRTVPTREDVQMAIQATGACVLPVLSRSHSTHLLCYEAKGEKYKKAESWNFDNILSPEWLLECLVQWKYVPEVPFRITSSGGPDVGKIASESVPIAAETEKEEMEMTSAAATGATNTPTVSDTDTKPAPSRFDVGELLDELNEQTPKAKVKRSKGALKLGAAAAEVPAKFFDTPSSATRTRSSRGSAVGADVNEASIPEDFEFQFGKKAKTRGKTKATDRKVVFEEKQPEKEPTKATKAKRTARRKSDGGTDGASAAESETTAGGIEGDEAQDAVDTPSSKVGPKKEIRKAAAATGRKRKSVEAASTTDSSASTPASEVIAPPSTKTKKKKSIKPINDRIIATSHAAPSGSNDSGRLFLLTGSREECAINESLITSLGGAVSQVTGRIYDPACTHIITSELKRTEKFVAGCAGGKWILKQSYLDASSAAGRFVNEADHEWGSNEVDVDEMDPRIWPPVCSFWRNARAASPLPPGAFDGWRFLVHPKAVPPAEMCERIIAAADGEVISLSTSMDLAAVAASSTKEKPVVALVHAELSSRDTWRKKFKASKVRCINASFLIDYLTKDQTNRPKVDDYVL